MTFGRVVVTSVVGLVIGGCFPRSMTEDEGMGTVNGLDTSRAGLERFTSERGYSGWRAEAGTRPSVASHGARVRVFFNEMLAASLEAGNAVHPVGSTTVKELYEGDGETLRGHALDVKVVEGEGPDTWLFYEGFTGDDEPFYGKGHPTCQGCHASGIDFVRTPLP